MNPSAKTPAIIPSIYEIIPMKSAQRAIAELPPESLVSVTCSPVKGISETQDLTHALMNKGHTVVPHFAAKMIESKQHVKHLANWLRTEGVNSVFIIGGDAKKQEGPYSDAYSLMEELLENDPNLESIGFGCYPDGHSFIPDEKLVDAALNKQELITSADVEGWATTQMCFNFQKIIDWSNLMRNAGLTVPINLGIPGVVSKTQLLTIGAKIGVGSSLSFLKKNKSSVVKLIGSYEPTDLINQLHPHFAELNMNRLHIYTFNQVESTIKWEQEFFES